nr:E-beta-farnesene synthase [Tanacetum cinerariifolium]
MSSNEIKEFVQLGFRQAHMGRSDTMADVNVNAPADQAPTMAPSTRTDDQILPHIRWVPIGKSDCYLDVEKSQSNPIYKIALWDTIPYDKTGGCYKCQLDEQWFDLTKYTLRDTLQITPVNNKTFSSPPSSDALINFVNELGYPKLLRNLYNIILWGVVNRAHLNYAERIWEEFTQSIHTFIEDKKNLAQHTDGKKKATLIVILKPILGYLKFRAKGTKREVFGVPIPGNLITADIQGESYYQEYLVKVAKHQRYLLGEIGSDPDSPALKPTKNTKKSKPAAPKAALRPPVTKPVPSQQNEPQPAPTKTQGKKRKLVTEISDKPSQARKSRPGLVSKQRKPISSLRSVDESMAEGIPKKEPRVDDKEADLQRALEESLKIICDVPWGPLLPVVIRKPESKKYQPLPEVQGKGREKVNKEHVALRWNLMRMYRGVMREFKAGPNPGDATTSQPLTSPIVHAGPNLEHMDFEVADVSTQPHPEQIDEGFIATAYPKVHENLKLTVEEQVILEEPASSTGTLSSPQRLMKDLSFGDLFFNDKPLEAYNEKTNAETEAESMYSVTIQLDTSSIPPMTTLNRFRDLPKADMKEILHQRMWETNSYKTHKDHNMLYEALEKSMNRDHSEELTKHLADARKNKKKRHDSPKMPHGFPPHQPPPPPPPTGESGALGSPGSFGSSQVSPPPPLPLSTNQEEERLATPKPAWSISSSDVPVPKNNWASALASTYSPPPEDSLLSHTGDIAMFIDWFCKRQGITEFKPQDLHNVSKPLPLGGPPSQVTIQYDFFFNKDLEYLRYSSKGSKPVLSISKMKAAYYPDVGLEKMVPDQMWIKEECKYDIASMYEYFQLGIESYQTQLNLTKPRWDATGFEYKHDYMVIDFPRAITFRDRYGVQMIMRFNEIYKLSDGTLQQIDEALDYQVKEFMVNRMNPSLNTRF